MRGRSKFIETSLSPRRRRKGFVLCPPNVCHSLCWDTPASNCTRLTGESNCRWSPHLSIVNTSIEISSLGTAFGGADHYLLSLKIRKVNESLPTKMWAVGLGLGGVNAVDLRHLSSRME